MNFFQMNGFNTQQNYPNNQFNVNEQIVQAPQLGLSWNSCSPQDSFSPQYQQTLATPKTYGESPVFENRVSNHPKPFSASGQSPWLRQHDQTQQAFSARLNPIVQGGSFGNGGGNFHPTSEGRFNNGYNGQSLRMGSDSIMDRMFNAFQSKMDQTPSAYLSSMEHMGTAYQTPVQNSNSQHQSPIFTLNNGLPTLHQQQNHQQSQNTNLKETALYSNSYGSTSQLLLQQAQRCVEGRSPEITPLQPQDTYSNQSSRDQIQAALLIQQKQLLQQQQQQQPLNTGLSYGSAGTAVGQQQQQQQQQLNSQQSTSSTYVKPHYVPKSSIYTAPSVPSFGNSAGSGGNSICSQSNHYQTSASIPQFSGAPAAQSSFGPSFAPVAPMAAPMGVYFANNGAVFQQQMPMVMVMPTVPSERQVQLPAKPKVVDAKDVFFKPGRESRPDRVCVILRGLPGSGKTHVAQKMRDIEKAAPDGLQPRILSLDDYFLTETTETRTDAAGMKRKEKSMKYEFDPEMETVYIAAFLKSFKKTIEEGHFKFIIVEGINCMVCHFEEFWSAAKSKGFEVYIVNLPVEVEVCAARNKYGWKAADIQQVADRWEDTPAHMLVMDLKSILDEPEPQKTNSSISTDISEAAQKKRRSFQEADFSAPNKNEDDSTLKNTQHQNKDEDSLETFEKLFQNSSRDDHSENSEKQQFSMEEVQMVFSEKKTPKASASRWENSDSEPEPADDSEEEEEEEEEVNALSSLLGDYGSSKKKRRRVTWKTPIDDWGDRSKRYLFEADNSEGDKEKSSGFTLVAVASAQKLKENQEREMRIKNVRGIVKSTLIEERSSDKSILDKALKDHHIKNTKQNILSALHQLVEEEDDDDEA